MEIYKKYARPIDKRKKDATQTIKTNPKENATAIPAAKPVTRETQQASQFAERKKTITKRPSTAQQMKANLVPPTIIGVNIGIVAKHCKAPSKGQARTLKEPITRASTNDTTKKIKRSIQTSTALIQKTQAVHSTERMKEVSNKKIKAKEKEKKRTEDKKETTQ
ncbi:hypothetical protein [Lysinibacillus fusiformis]|uniref:hypothetical protein n=1 Tax=Lysinibacillus fusiformis TaxID=28031 RepID=UPI0008F1EE97|nr:hypothetical protein [Lysinibacillus fusiformis]SFS34893.1 hypothetical protein SAMN02787099_00265 [Lysinibacillus fusiformis]